MREYLDKVIKADQYVDDIGIAANDADHLIKNLKATFECIRHAGLKLTMHKCHFGATEIDFLGRTNTPEGVKPQKERITNSLEKTKFPKSKKALQRYLGFLNYYRNYIPRLSEKLAPFFELLKKDEKVLVTTELIQQFNEINRDLDKCSQLALKQPLPNKQLVLMTDASFTAAGYAILTEDDPNQKYSSVKKSYAPQKHLKMASGEYRRQWHKYLPLAVLNYNTTYHSSIGCEPSKVFHGRIPYNVLDHKLGNNPNKDFLPTTDFAEELQQRTKVLIDKTKHNISITLAKIQNEVYSEELLQQDIRYKHYLNNLDRIVLKDEIVTRQYYDETGRVKYHQVLLPKHLLTELLQTLHGTAHKHPGISKMLQEIRQKYYYPGIAKHVKKWVEGCVTCAKDKRVPNNTITPELLNLPKWDLGPEDAMQIDLLPNLPTSGGYQTVMTAIDVFSRYLFAYPLVEATASNTAKVLIDVMTKHSYLPTTIITDKGTAFTSKIIAEITQVMEITLKSATTKRPQTIGKLERTHASLKTNLKMASGEYRRQWHKYLPLAVLNYNTTYHSSIGCEPSKVFHGRIPYNVLDHKLGNNPNKDFLPTTDFAEELQQRTKVLIDKTKHNISITLAKIQNEDYSEELLQQDIRYKHYLNNLDRIVLKDEIVTRQYYDETGRVKYHQVLLPKHLLTELLQALHGTAHKHPGISKMLQEIRQKYYYPGIAKHVKKWVEGCVTCAKDKRVPNNTITPELLNLPKWDLGPEDAMQIDLLPNLPTSGGYQTVMTAIDVFSRYLFAYPLVEATASNTAKVLIDVMTKHSYLPTTIITDKGTAFTSKIIAEITQVMEITLKSATTKHPQTIGKLERTHASLKTNLKMASGEYRRQWHKYLPLAVLNYNTTYHSSIGVQHWSPALELLQSYLKYKEYYDRKAKAAPLSEQEICFILQPKADNQGSKIPFREYRWIGPYRIEKVLPNDNYIVRRLNTNKTQILHRIRLKKFVPNTPLEDKYAKEKLQPDDEIIIPQDDLYTISWEADFDYHVFEPRRDDNTDEELQTPDSDAGVTTSDYVIYDNADDNAVRPGKATSRDGTITRDANDVTGLNERTKMNENEAGPSTAASRDAPIVHDEHDVNENAARDEQSSETGRPRTATSRNNHNGGNTPPTSEKNVNDVTNELEGEESSLSEGDDITVPGISNGKTNEKTDENFSPRGGKYNLRPNPNPNYTDEYRY